MLHRQDKWLSLASAAFGLVAALFALGAQAQVNATFVSKVWSPSSVAINGVSTLTVSIQNNTAVALTGVTFTDTLPAGLASAAPGLNFVSGCGGGSSITNLVGPPAVFSGVLNIPANGTCVVSNTYASAISGLYTNSTANISGWNGNALAFAASTLAVGVTAVTTPVPTLSQYALLLLAFGVAFVAWRVRRAGPAA